MNRFVLRMAAPLVFAASLAANLVHAQEATPSSGTVITGAGAAANAAPEKFNQGILFPYSILDRALTGRVDDNGNVDYVALKDNADLARFLRAVATADLRKFPVFTVEPSEDELAQNRAAKPKTDRSAELVFWINAYNAHILNALTNAYPVNSVDEIKDFETAPRRIAGEDLTFPQMRERIAKFDRRAVFALSDGTVSGPLLNPAAYRWDAISRLLDHAVVSYVNNPENVTVRRIENKVEITPFLESVNDYFADGRIAGGAERRKLTGVRAILGQYTDKRANRSYLSTNDYALVIKQPVRRLNMKGIAVRKLE